MKTSHFVTSACRYCRYYSPEGRRGGNCQQLGVPVQASWKACTLALPPFAPTWETLEEIVFLENTLSLDYVEDGQASKVKASDAKNMPTKNQPTRA